MKRLWIFASLMAVLAIALYFMFPGLSRQDAFWIAAGITMVLYFLTRSST